MIVFDLECVNGHAFEGWFDDSDDFSRQQEQGLIACPLCETYSVVQKLSAVAIKTSANVSFDGHARHDALADINAKLIDYVENNFENVGSNFAREALKIYYGASEPKNIRGITTGEEDKILKEEGVPVLRFDSPKDSDKDELN